MRRMIVSVAAAGLLLVPAMVGQKPQATAKTASDASLARGKYLVEAVAKCGDCHTPDNEKGEPIKDKWLQGAPLTFKPSVPLADWADKAPGIAGLPGWEGDAAIKTLMTGVRPNGKPLRPPMPEYHLNHADAVAVVAYLKSLTPAK